MTDALTQDQRPARLATKLDKDKLLLTRFDGEEALGEMFEFRVEALSQDPGVDFYPLMGLDCSFRLETSDGVGRDFGGVLAEAVNLGPLREFTRYRLVLRPWLWLLSLTSRSWIFKAKTPKDIILEVFSWHDFGQKVVDLATHEYPTLEYAVQYRETDLNFVLRLMEKYGIYYYFTFYPGEGGDPGAHALVLADSSTHAPLPAPPQLWVVGPDNPVSDQDQRLFNWTESRVALTTFFQLRDYNYQTPNANMEAPAVLTIGDRLPPVNAAVRDYPGGYANAKEGYPIADVLRDAEEARAVRCYSEGYAPSLLPGHKIKRIGDGRTDASADQLILRCQHSYGVQTYLSTTTDDGGASYSGAYEFAPDSQKYRMPLRTRRPVIAGTQSAKVIADDNEEIDVDNQGRIQVQFYWTEHDHDSAGKRGAVQPSRRVRVAQFWAGNTRGAFFIPRKDDEVLVQFEEGDPDRPIIVGSVYNGENKINKELPKDKNQSGILTRSTKNSTGYNMLLFDDSKGAEKIKLRAEKDLMFKALNNEIRDIGANQTETIGGDETINVGGPTAGGNFTLNAEQTVTINVGPKGSPLTQIVMDTTSITLNVGPGGAIAQVKLDPSGVTISGTAVSSLAVQPAGISMMTPTYNVEAIASINLMSAAVSVEGLATANILSPAVNIGAAVTMPLVTIGTGTCGGLPII